MDEKDTSLEERNIAPIIAEALEVFGSQAEIVRETGFDKQRVSHWARGRNGPGLMAIRTLEKAIDKRRAERLHRIAEGSETYGYSPIIIAVVDGGERYICERTDNPQIDDITFHDGHIGKWNYAPSDPTKWIFKPLDGADPDVVDGRPWNRVVGKIAPIE